MTEGSRVTDELRLAILDGRYPPATPLRQEDIAARHHATRMPVREALRTLTGEGLVEMHGRQAAVAAHDPEIENLLYRMRERLEPLALEESVPRLTDADIDDLDQIQDRIEATTDVREFLRLDQELHLATYTGCDIDILISSVRNLWNQTHAYRRAFMLSGGAHRAEVVNFEHRLLIDAIRRRDTTAGGELLAGHIRRTRVQMADATATAG